MIEVSLPMVLPSGLMGKGFEYRRTTPSAPLRAGVRHTGFPFVVHPLFEFLRRLVLK